MGIIFMGAGEDGKDQTQEFTPSKYSLLLWAPAPQGITVYVEKLPEKQGRCHGIAI